MANATAPILGPSKDLVETIVLVCELTMQWFNDLILMVHSDDGWRKRRTIKKELRYYGAWITHIRKCERCKKIGTHMTRDIEGFFRRKITPK